MTFFNKKEEVLEIKLSSYGKQKLAAGTFKPVYYAFFDDDILYESEKAGVSEDNNNTEPRIQENTPSLRVQTNFTDLERKVMMQTHELSADGVFHESNVTDLKHDPSVFLDYDGLRNVLPLGNSQLSNQYVASWRIDFLASSYKNYRTTTRDPSVSCSTPYSCQKPIINIPQINVDLNVQPVLVQKDFVGLVDPETGRYTAMRDDSSFIRLTDDYILLDVQEMNVDLLNDSFSIEVYEVIEDPDTGKEKLFPKLFKKEIQRIVDGIMLEDDEIDAQIITTDVDDRFAEYYFDIAVDDGIDSKTKFEKIVSREMKGNIFDNNVGFEEFSQTPGSELYTSDNDGGEC
tara:strand:+ start:7149 stop:8183 length:1035 start_codon:yes stop_codon:yes gene_type:complete